VNPTDDTVARYDPHEAVSSIAAETGVDDRTVALILEGEIDYLGCIGMLDEAELDDDTRREIAGLRQENTDILEASTGEYDAATAVAFIQRNRGIDKDTIRHVLEANFRFMDERGFLDDDWGES
jgi:hypothetical protein